MAIAALLIPLALAGGAAAQFAGGSVSGAGFVRTTFEGQEVAFQIIVAAHGDPTGATGHVTLASDRMRFRASADCVIVVGNAALVIGTLDEPFDGFTQLQVEIVDNGNGRSGVPDAAIGGVAAPPPFPFDRCNPAAIDFSDAFPIERGNFVVKPSGL